MVDRYKQIIKYKGMQVGYTNKNKAIILIYYIRQCYVTYNTRIHLCCIVEILCCEKIEEEKPKSRNGIYQRLMLVLAVESLELWKGMLQR